MRALRQLGRSIGGNIAELENRLVVTNPLEMIKASKEMTSQFLAEELGIKYQRDACNLLASIALASPPTGRRG